MHRVAVLMSTYNGVKYIREQIESILSQKNVSVELFIRDDGSSDGTIDICREYAEKCQNVVLTIGSNLGVGKSFMQLVYDCPDDYDYYAFSDQDDVWLENKLERAIEKLEIYDGGVLYSSNQTLVDAALNEIGKRYTTPPDISSLQIMCCNYISGCTFVWNRELQNLLSDEKRRPHEELLKKRIHDVWVAFVASVIGKIIYDSESYILYRQHGNNVVGVRKKSIIKVWLEKLKDPSKRNGRSAIAREIEEKYGDLIDGDTKEKLDLYSFYIENNSYKKKLLSTAGEITKHTGESLFALRLKILFNLF